MELHLHSFAIGQAFKFNLVTEGFKVKDIFCLALKTFQNDEEWFLFKIDGIINCTYMTAIEHKIENICANFG